RRPPRRSLRRPPARDGSPRVRGSRGRYRRVPRVTRPARIPCRRRSGRPDRTPAWTEVAPGTQKRSRGGTLGGV
ncbi:hypothetical protein BRC60_05245, partial [Halobacteriales archaeon QH_1_68_42]